MFISALPFSDINNQCLEVRNDARTGCECNCTRKPEKSRTSQLPKLLSQLRETFPISLPFILDLFRTLYYIVSSSVFYSSPRTAAQLHLLFHLCLNWRIHRLSYCQTHRRVLVMIRNRSLVLTRKFDRRRF